MIFKEWIRVKMLTEKMKWELLSDVLLKYFDTLILSRIYNSSSRLPYIKV